jgi:hypothetical protein
MTQPTPVRVQGASSNASQAFPHQPSHNTSARVQEVSTNKSSQISAQPSKPTSSSHRVMSTSSLANAVTPVVPAIRRASTSLESHLASKPQIPTAQVQPSQPVGGPLMRSSVTASLQSANMSRGSAQNATSATTVQTANVLRPTSAEGSRLTVADATSQPQTIQPASKPAIPNGLSSMMIPLTHGQLPPGKFWPALKDILPIPANSRLTAASSVGYNVDRYVAAISRMVTMAKTTKVILTEAEKRFLLLLCKWRFYRNTSSRYLILIIAHRSPKLRSARGRGAGHKPSRDNGSH